MNYKYVHEKVTKKSIFTKAKFELGDSVRISKYEANWATELFTIAEVNNIKPEGLTYILKDENGELIKGGFYDKELFKTNYKELYSVEKVIKKIEWIFSVTGK